MANVTVLMYGSETYNDKKAKHRAETAEMYLLHTVSSVSL